MKYGKRGPAIQNALLTVINEKVYRNGNNLLRIPLKGLIAASNELPAQGQGLEALYDRFLIRLLVGGVEDVSDFDRMVLSSDESEPVVPEDLPVDREEYAEWQRRISEIKVHYSVLEVIHLLREQIEEYNGRIENDASGSALSVCVRPAVEKAGQADAGFCLSERIGYGPFVRLPAAGALPLGRAGPD